MEENVFQHIILLKFVCTDKTVATVTVLMRAPENFQRMHEWFEELFPHKKIDHMRFEENFEPICLN